MGDTTCQAAQRLQPPSLFQRLLHPAPLADLALQLGRPIPYRQLELAGMLFQRLPVVAHGELQAARAQCRAHRHQQDFARGRAFDQRDVADTRQACKSVVVDRCAVVARQGQERQVGPCRLPFQRRVQPLQRACIQPFLGNDSAP